MELPSILSERIAFMKITCSRGDIRIGLARRCHLHILRPLIRKVLLAVLRRQARHLLVLAPEFVDHFAREQIADVLRDQSKNQHAICR